jgi:hypothetical protein
MVKSDVVRDVDHYLSVYFPFIQASIVREESLQSLRCDPMMQKRIDL